MNSIIALLLVSPLLAAVAYCDLRYMRIPNSLSIAMLLVFISTAIVFPPDDLITRVLVAAVVFAVGFTCFCLRLLGGGDVKILTALMLFIPAQGLVLFSFLFSASMIFGVIAILGLRRLPQTDNYHWKSLSGSTKFPMGISISLAGICCPFALLVSGMY